MNTQDQTPSGLRRFGHGFVVVGGAVVLALACFLVLPLLQAITKTEQADMDLRSADIAKEKPPEPVEEQKKEEKEEKPPPPQVDNNAPPPDLADLELALNPGFGGGAGSFSIALGGFGEDSQNSMDKLFDFDELEEQPRPIFKQRPRVSAAMKKRLPCTVYILMTVNDSGRVENPSVHSSDDPIFDAPALAAVKQWKFEPGKRRGKPDSFRVRQPITFK